jgi:lysyl-tRNA synthetase class 2
MSHVPKNDKPLAEPQWQPHTSPEQLRLRANTINQIRTFFAQKQLLEVDTPVLSVSTIADPFIESFQTGYQPLTQRLPKSDYYLHTSPEFPMKRLLAAGSGSIFQIAKVFRQGELGSRHNPEFTLLEWYREGWNHEQLMQEVLELLTMVISPHQALGKPVFLSYQQVFEQYLGFNPHLANKQDLIDCCAELGLSNVLAADEDRDRYLELLFSHKIEPYLGVAQQESESLPCLCFIYHYPASQASLARITKIKEAEVAERFEIFINGMELGNGFHELNDPQEQRKRFQSDNNRRKIMGLQEVPLDEHFLAALEELPDCAGVAIGIERLLMVISGAKHIQEVLNFPFEYA